jgi:hypothetical protein
MCSESFLPAGLIQKLVEQLQILRPEVFESYLAIVLPSLNPISRQ